MPLNLRILLLSACIALNFTSSASHPFDTAVVVASATGGSDSNAAAAGGRGRSSGAKKGNDATAAHYIMAVQFMRREQLLLDESTVAAPSEAGSLVTTIMDAAAIANGGVDAEDNDTTMTGSTMAEEFPLDNNNNNDDDDDEGTNAVSAANLTMSTRSDAPSLSPSMNSSWEIMSSNNATTSLGEGESKEGEANTNTHNPSPTPSPSSTTLSPAVSTFGGVDDESEGAEELGEPLVREDGSNVPTPSMDDHADSDNWNDDDFENNDYDMASFVPTPSDAYYVDANDDFYAAEESVWEETFTPPPTVIYVPPPTDEDPLIQEEAKESGGVSQGASSNVGDEGNDTENNDNVLYHGLGGTVGTYMDGIESPTEMEKDKNIQIVTGTLLSLFVVALLITAHLVMHHPDGLCAGCCRLALGLIGCAGRTLCLPCRAVCCSGSEQSRNRRSHAPMRTPFPTDLELT